MANPSICGWSCFADLGVIGSSSLSWPAFGSWFFGVSWRSAGFCRQNYQLQAPWGRDPTFRADVCGALHVASSCRALAEAPSFTMEALWFGWHHWIADEFQRLVASLFDWQAEWVEDNQQTSEWPFSYWAFQWVCFFWASGSKQDCGRPHVKQCISDAHCGVFLWWEPQKPKQRHSHGGWVPWMWTRQSGTWRLRQQRCFTRRQGPTAKFGTVGEDSSFAPKSVEPGTNKVCFCGCYRTRSYVLCLFHTLPSKLQSNGRNRLVLNVKLEPSLALICKWPWTRRDSMPRTCKPWASFAIVADGGWHSSKIQFWMACWPLDHTEAKQADWSKLPWPSWRSKLPPMLKRLAVLRPFVNWLTREVDFPRSRAIWSSWPTLWMFKWKRRTRSQWSEPRFSPLCRTLQWPVRHLRHPKPSPRPHHRHRPQHHLSQRAHLRDQRGPCFQVQVQSWGQWPTWSAWVVKKPWQIKCSSSRIAWVRCWRTGWEQCCTNQRTECRVFCLRWCNMWWQWAHSKWAIRWNPRMPRCFPLRCRSDARSFQVEGGLQSEACHQADDFSGLATTPQRSTGGVHQSTTSHGSVQHDLDQWDEAAWESGFHGGHELSRSFCDWSVHRHGTHCCCSSSYGPQCRSQPDVEDRLGFYGTQSPKSCVESHWFSQAWSCDFSFPLWPLVTLASYEPSRRFARKKGSCEAAGFVCHRGGNFAVEGRPTFHDRESTAFRSLAIGGAEEVWSSPRCLVSYCGYVRFQFAIWKWWPSPQTNKTALFQSSLDFEYDRPTLWWQTPAWPSHWRFQDHRSRWTLQPRVFWSCG